MVPLLRKETLRVEKLAGIVPVPVAAIIAGSAWCKSHSIVSPSDLLPNSLVSWKTLAAHKAGIRMRRPRPSTLVCRSLEGFLAGFTATAVELLLLLLLFVAVVVVVVVAVVVVVEEGLEGEEEESKLFLECMEMEPMKGGPWPGV